MSAYTHAVGWLLLTPVAIFGILFAGLMIISFRSVYRSLDIYFLSLCSILFLNVVILVCMQAAMFIRNAQWTKSSCDFYVWCTVTLRFAVILTLVTLSIDRVLILHLNIKYKYKGTPRIALIVFGVWVAAMLVGAVPVMGWTQVVVMTTNQCSYLVHELDRHFGIFVVVMELFTCFLAAGCLVDVLLHMRHLTKNAFFTPETVSSIFSVDITLTSRDKKARMAPSRVETSLGFASAYDNSRFVCILVLIVFLLNHFPHMVVTIAGVVGQPNAETCRLVVLWFMLLESIIVPHLFWFCNARYRRRAKHVIDALLGRDTLFDDGGAEEIYLESYFRKKGVVHPIPEHAPQHQQHKVGEIRLVNGDVVDDVTYQISQRQHNENGEELRIKKSNNARLIKKSRSVRNQRYRSSESSSCSKSNIKTEVSVHRKYQMNRACSLDTHLDITSMMEGADKEEGVIYSDREGTYGPYLAPLPKRLARSMSDLSRSFDRRQIFGSSSAASSAIISLTREDKSRDVSPGSVAARHQGSDSDLPVTSMSIRAVRMRSRSRKNAYVNPAYEDDVEQEYADFHNDVIQVRSLDSYSESDAEGHLKVRLKPPKTPSDTTSVTSASSRDTDMGVTMEYSDDFIAEVLDGSSTSGGNSHDYQLNTDRNRQEKLPHQSSTGIQSANYSHLPNGGGSNHRRMSMPTQINPLYHDSSSCSEKSRSSSVAVRAHNLKMRRRMGEHPVKEKNPYIPGPGSTDLHRASSLDSKKQQDGLLSKYSSKASSAASELSWKATPTKESGLPFNPRPPSRRASAKARVTGDGSHGNKKDFVIKGGVGVEADEACIRTLPLVPPHPPPAPPPPPLPATLPRAGREGRDRSPPRAPFSSPVKLAGQSTYYPSGPGPSAPGHNGHSGTREGTAAQRTPGSRERMMEELALRLNNIQSQTHGSETDDNTSEFSTADFDAPPSKPVRVEVTSRPQIVSHGKVRKNMTSQRRLTAQRALMQEAKKYLQGNQGNAPENINNSESNKQNSGLTENTQNGDGTLDLDAEMDVDLARKYRQYQQIGSQRGLFTREQLETMETEMLSRGRGKIIGYYPNGRPIHEPEVAPNNSGSESKPETFVYEPEMML